jgi:predicted oxidoreductase
MSDNAQKPQRSKRIMRRSKGITRRKFIIGTAIGVAGAAALGSGVTLLLSPSMTTTQSMIPSKWDLTADVVVIGGGAAGLPAAIKAAVSGASVIIVEANYDVGGHAITSGGNVPLGGGTAAQQKYNITDSPDQIFLDLTDWSVVEANGAPDYRYNDRAIIRAFADNNVATYNLLVDSGVKFADRPPDAAGGQSVGNSAPRENHVVWGRGASAESPSGGNGTAFIRPLETTARAKRSTIPPELPRE